MTDSAAGRFWELDCLRGVAIIMMVVYHFLFDLSFFGVYAINMRSLAIQLFLYPIGTLFLLLVGMSLSISYRRARDRLTASQVHRKFIARGLWVLGGGMLITAATWLFLGNGFIIFGVLHCIGVSIILAYPLVRFRFTPLVLGVLFIALGLYLRVSVRVDFPWLLWLGVIPSDLYTLDYFPLLPWFGVVLVGVFLGTTLYAPYERRFSLPDISQKKVTVGLGFLGRHSLLIYFVHQPLLLALVALLAAARTV